MASTTSSFSKSRRVGGTRAQRERKAAVEEKIAIRTCSVGHSISLKLQESLRGFPRFVDPRCKCSSGWLLWHPLTGAASPARKPQAIATGWGSLCKTKVSEVGHRPPSDPCGFDFELTLTLGTPSCEIRTQLPLHLPYQPAGYQLCDSRQQRAEASRGIGEGELVETPSTRTHAHLLPSLAPRLHPPHLTRSLGPEVGGLGGPPSLGAQT